jgi:hypothetical protein
MEKSEKNKQEVPMSLVERKRNEALESVLAILSERFPVELRQSFESHGTLYALTSPEDCMVAFAQQNREAVELLHKEIVSENDYRKEQAIAKVLELFLAYEKTVALYAELRSYYPRATGKLEEKLPPLTEIAAHGDTLWKNVQKN